MSVAILIDYENVNDAGLLGYEYIKQDDIVYLFYSNNAKNIEKIKFNKIIETGCEFKAIKLLSSRANALDFYIVSAMAELVTRGVKNIAIISNDNGYKSSIEYFNTYSSIRATYIHRKNIMDSFMAAQCNKDDKERAEYLTSISEKGSIEEMWNNYQNMKKFEKKITDAFQGTEFVFQVPKIMELFTDTETDDKKKLYLESLKTFGKNNGCVIYNKLKEVI